MSAGERDWRITGVSLRSAGVHDQLAPQGGLYTITVKGEGEPRTRVIGSVGRVLVAPRVPDAVVATLASERTRIASFTVTEKGYEPDPSRGWALVDTMVGMGAPESAPVYRGWASLFVAKALVRAGLPDSARAVLRQVVPRPTPAWAAYDAAHVSVMLGDVPEALGFLEEVGAISPAQVAAYIQEFPYNKLVFLMPPWQSIYTTDGQRDQTFSESIQVFEKLKAWYGRWWWRVLLSVRGTVEQPGSISHGLVQVTTRHMIGPTHDTWLLQLPYRKTVQPSLRLPQLRHWQRVSEPRHTPEEPHPQAGDCLLQSM